MPNGHVRMASIRIDETARFVSILSLPLGPDQASETTREVQRIVELRVSKEEGFIGAVVIRGRERSELLVVSVWESAHAWSEAEYDRDIGQTVANIVETIKSYDVQTYETVTVVRAGAH